MYNNIPAFELNIGAQFTGFEDKYSCILGLARVVSNNK